MSKVFDYSQNLHGKDRSVEDDDHQFDREEDGCQPEEAEEEEYIEDFYGSNNEGTLEKAHRPEKRNTV
jgi:hypothetical protein